MTLVSTYDLGRQPFGVASAAAWLREAGHEVTQVDTSRARLEVGAVSGAGIVAFHLPMHTATRLALALIPRVRQAAPSSTLVAFGLDHVLGVEAEADLLALVSAMDAGQPPPPPSASLPRLAFRVPDREGLPAPERYARLRLPNGARRVAGSTEASRGCKHWCRHCPIVPVYRGQFRILPVDVVLADIAQQVERGVTHVTFGDPDFLNGPRHAMAVAEQLASRFGGLTYDVTIKVEHLVRHADLLPRLRATGCVLVTSAFESFDDEVLDRLQKGHTAEDARRAVRLCREAGLDLAPTFVAFTPWTSVEGYGAFLHELAALDLVSQVAPIQLALRLLLPAGSALLDLDEMQALAGPVDATRLVHPWRHDSPEVDALQHDVEHLVAARAGAPRHEVFATVADLAALYGAGPALPPADVPARVEVPYLDELWYC